MARVYKKSVNITSIYLQYVFNGGIVIDRVRLERRGFEMSLTNTLEREIQDCIENAAKALRVPTSGEWERSAFKAALTLQINHDIAKQLAEPHTHGRAQIWAVYALHENFGTFLQIVKDEHFGWDMDFDTNLRISVMNAVTLVVDHAVQIACSEMRDAELCSHAANWMLLLKRVA